MWNSGIHLTKATRFNSGINNESPLENILVYVIVNCGHTYFRLQMNDFIFPYSSQKKRFCCLEAADLVYYTFETFCNEVLQMANITVLKLKYETNLFDFSQTTCIFKVQEPILEVSPTWVIQFYLSVFCTGLDKWIVLD